MLTQFTDTIKEFIHNISNNKKLLLTISSVILLTILLISIISARVLPNKFLKSYGNKCNGDKLIEYIEKNKNKSKKQKFVCLSVSEILSNNIGIGSNYLLSQLEHPSTPIYLKDCIENNVIIYENVDYNLDILCTLLIDNKIIRQNTNQDNLSDDEIFSPEFWTTIESKIKEFSNDEIETTFATKISSYINEDKIAQGINILDYYLKNSYGVINIYNKLDISLDKLNYYYANTSMTAEAENIISDIIYKRVKEDIEISFIKVFKDMFSNNWNKNIDNLVKLSSFYKKHNFTENENVKVLIDSINEIANNNFSIDNLTVALSSIEDEIFEITEQLQQVNLSLSEVQNDKTTLDTTRNIKISELDILYSYTTTEFFIYEKLGDNKYLAALPFDTFLGKFPSTSKAIIYLENSSFNKKEWHEINVYQTGSEETTVKGTFSSSTKELPVFIEVSNEDYTSIDKLNEEIQTLDTQIETIESNISRISDETNELQSQITTLETQRQELQTEIDNLTIINDEKETIIESIIF